MYGGSLRPGNYSVKYGTICYVDNFTGSDIKYPLRKKHEETYSRC